MNVNYNERIEKLKQKLHILEQCNILYNYFYPIRKFKNSYLVEMRRIIGQQLYDLGISKVDISGIFGKDHSTIVHLLNIESNPAIEKEVAIKYKLWIELGLYPESIFVIEPSDIHKQGNKHTLEYRLTNKLVSVNNNRDNFICKSVTKYFKERMFNLIESEDYILCRARHSDSLINKIKLSYPNHYKLIEERENEYQEKILILNSKEII